MRRRDVLRLGASLPLVLGARSGWAAADQEGTAFDPDTVAGMARQLAAQPYKPPNATLPDTLKNLDYSAYQTIRFNPDRALWRGQGSNFNAAFFHRGYLYKERVDLFEVADGRATPIQYSADMFSWEKLKPPTEDLGFAGFRLNFPLNRVDYFDEVCAFLGASYFRAVARGQGYGLSARGLAIKTADSSGEEFPFFRSFWLERPVAGADSITIHALLDSQSAAGAFRFVIRPGQETVFDTEVSLYPRVDIAQAGLAPLTSMFFFAPNNPGGTTDWRAAVHDSGGLALRTGRDERIWRPLINPRNLQISAFSDTAPRGYGLLQRPRQFAGYEDLEARYEKRPSLWIEPRGDWGQGVVELVEIPSDKEVNDNVVAFWRPHEPLKAKSEFKLAYQMHWCWTEAEPGPFARALQTRSGKSWNGDNQQYVVDFAGGSLDAAKPEAPPALDVGTDKGKIVHAVVEPNPDIGGWRVSIELDTQKQNVVELHARLMDGDKPLTETWIARWTPS